MIDNLPSYELSTAASANYGLYPAPFRDSALLITESADH